MNWSVRSAIRYGIVLVAGIIAGGRAMGAFEAWQQWRRWRERDPSGANGYRTFAEVDAVIAVLSLVIAGLIWWLLRPRSGKVFDGPAA